MSVQFFTDSQMPVPAVNTEEMREIDRIAIQETGPNLFQMMENAGRNLAMLAIEILGHHWEKANIVILAGTGGNGGGGICAGRHLENRNAKVNLCMTNPDKLADTPKYQLHVYQHANGRILQQQQLFRTPCDLVIDAIFGYGLTSEPGGKAKELIAWANSKNVPKISLDVPSGVHATNGRTPGIYIQPEFTLTLALPKTGLLPKLTGGLYLADIGIPVQTFIRIGINYTYPFDKSFMIKLRQRIAPDEQLM